MREAGEHGAGLHRARERKRRQPGDLNLAAQDRGHEAGVVVGDAQARVVGFGVGKAKEVPSAIRKGIESAKKNLRRVHLLDNTIPHQVLGKFGAGLVMLKPAQDGTGVIAGGPVRAVLECAGISDVLTKSLGSNNAINMVHATVAALKQLESPAAIAARRGRPLEDVAPAALIRASQIPVGA